MGFRKVSQLLSNETKGINTASLTTGKHSRPSHTDGSLPCERRTYPTRSDCLLRPASGEDGPRGLRLVTYNAALALSGVKVRGSR